MRSRCGSTATKKEEKGGRMRKIGTAVITTIACEDRLKTETSAINNENGFAHRNLFA